MDEESRLAAQRRIANTVQGLVGDANGLAAFREQCREAVDSELARLPDATADGETNESDGDPLLPQHPRNEQVLLLLAAIHDGYFDLNADSTAKRIVRPESEWTRDDVFLLNLFTAMQVRFDELDEGDFARLEEFLESHFTSKLKLKKTLKPPKPKASRPPADSKTILVSALTKHHRYADGSCLNQEPIGCNALAKSVGLSGGLASRFFKRYFKSHRDYERICASSESLIAALKLLNDEYTPGVLLGNLSEQVEGHD